ncbi:glycosyltransferase family 2 protein [uncultured Tateyamaria sp.]|uniref:glycosyltransferase family 2 protein n=1 Tax=uncultured Tateyamaria sp. TaxID=455651 RepID=UPI002634D534|nr:glycosyltransferase family 2 protein [uncultured Tateyamaria sp.]
MSDPLLRLSAPRPVARHDRPALPVGRQLVNDGLITQTTLLHALAIQRRIDAPIGEILVAEGHVAREDVLSALAIQHDTDRVDLSIDPPSPGMARALPAHLCQRFGVVPWRWIGRTLLIATTRPDQLKDLAAALPDGAPMLLPVIADQDQIITQTSRLFQGYLARHAVTRLSKEHSCRTWCLGAMTGRVQAGVLIALALGLAVAFPAWAFTLLIGFAVVTLAMTTTLKALALAAQITHRVPADVQPLPRVQGPRMARISVMVPLFNEERIAEALIQRLSKLSYPKALLDVVLVLEAKDAVTRATLARTDLPSWMRVIEVPDDGTITTKPRALNYALDFCNGDIIGVWDAEDAPETDQLEKVAAHFEDAAPNVACLQGILDYYNPRQNWLSRCFTIEYASWWRLVLPGVSRLGLVLPLGGTTLFFRRSILDELGGWDAHNVTEDADLGLRLARRGYTTELIPTATYEEANCRAWPWVKQRSRWIKGYLITYFVHMRRPRALLRDLGWMRFLGVQAMFMATVAQFASLPLLWSFWLPIFGLPHPVMNTLGAGIFWMLAVFFIATELLNITIGLLAVSDRNHRHLLKWVPTLVFYFPLGSLASYKALYELVAKPFYWDKTQHGHGQSEDTQPSS